MVWFGQVPVMLILAPAVRVGVVVPVPPADTGMVEGVTDSVGVVVEVATEGTSHDGQLPVGAMKLVTDPPPEPEPVKVQVVPEHDPAPEEKLKVNAPEVALMEVTPPAPHSDVQVESPVLKNSGQFDDGL